MNFILLVIISIIGIIDSAYLTYTHYVPVLVPCPATGIIDCGKVTSSPYSEIYGIPVALFGVLFYLFIFSSLMIIKLKKSEVSKILLVLASWAGMAFSIYLVFLQLVVIGAICIYCMLSAITSTLIFVYVNIEYGVVRNEIVLFVAGYLYKKIIKNIFFMFDAERVHEFMLSTGEKLGGNGFFKSLAGFFMLSSDKRLSQNIADINFATPVGMAAGFDYKAKLVSLLPAMGFGMMTVGTITNMSYEGNPAPRLGRLPKSKSLLVNKGYKNEGAEYISKKLSKKRFAFPLGVSIGRSNSEKLQTQEQSVKDILSAFKTFEKSGVKNSFYELNISCPNLIHGNVDFYSPKNLDQLLTAVDKLRIKKPIFIKMPIEKSDKEVLGMLKIISKHTPVGVIFGNLQKDRNHKSLVKSEVKKFKMGYFSGKPTFDRSNELIRLAYKNYKNRFVVIGCGGVFNASDAYTKIKLGASLVQLITGLIYEGPQLISQINNELPKLLQKDGYKHISEAVGVDVK